MRAPGPLGEPDLLGAPNRMAVPGPIPTVVIGRRHFDRDVLAQTLGAMPHLRVVGRFASVADSALERAEVAVLTMPDGSGIAIARAAALAKWSDDGPQPVCAAEIGWDAQPVDLAHIVELVARGLMPIPLPESDLITVLTPRESEVLGLLTRGHSIDQIAGDLEISGHTVRTYLSRINLKLGSHSRLELVSIALDAGLCSLGPEAPT